MAMEPLSLGKTHRSSFTTYNHVNASTGQSGQDEYKRKKESNSKQDLRSAKFKCICLAQHSSLSPIDIGRTAGRKGGGPQNQKTLKGSEFWWLRRS